MNSLGLLALGFFAAMLVFSMVARWLLTIGVVLEKHWTYDGSPKRRRTLLWALPAVLLLHSGPWAIFVSLLIAFSTLGATHADAWNWFFGGMLAGMALQTGFSIWVLLKFRKIRAARVAIARIA